MNYSLTIIDGDVNEDLAPNVTFSGLSLDEVINVGRFAIEHGMSLIVGREEVESG